MSGLIAAIGGSAALGFAGNMISSSASQGIAQAQAQQAQQTQTEALGYANWTPGELNAYSNQMSLANTSLNSAMTQMGNYATMQAQLSPTFTSAFGQIQDILSGGQTSLTAPAFQQFNIMRQQQQNSLLQSMGGGAGSSTAGAQSNALFGQAQAMTAMGVNQTALGSLQSLGQGAGSMIQSLGQAGQSGLANAANLSQGAFGMQQSIQSGQVAALEGTNLTPYAGSNNVGALGAGNALSGLAGTAMAGVNSVNSANNTRNLLAILAKNGTPSSSLANGIIGGGSSGGANGAFSFTPSNSAGSSYANGANLA